MANKRRRFERATGDPEIDETNGRILVELQRNGRVSFAELGRRVGLSPPAVADRVQRLEADGVITGYRAQVDPRALGLALSALIRVRPAPGQLKTVAEVARETEEVVDCHRVTGDDCYVMTMHLRDVEHLEQVIDRFAALGQTTTSIMQSSPVRDRPVVPPGASPHDPAPSPDSTSAASPTSSSTSRPAGSDRTIGAP